MAGRPAPSGQARLPRPRVPPASGWVLLARAWTIWTPGAIGTGMVPRYQAMTRSMRRFRCLVATAATGGGASRPGDSLR
jgi:hypothetical protein